MTMWDSLSVVIGALTVAGALVFAGGAIWNLERAAGPDTQHVSFRLGMAGWWVAALGAFALIVIAVAGSLS